MSGYGGVTLNINCCVKQRVTFRVRSVGVWVLLSFSIPHTLYHSFYIPPLPSLHHSFSLWWEQVERFLRDIGWQLRWWLIDIFAQEWKGTVGTGCVGVTVSCPHGLVRENVAQTEASRFWRLAKVALRKVSRACLYTSHPRIANFGCDPNCVRRKTEQSIIVLTKHSIKGKVLWCLWLFQISVESEYLVMFDHYGKPSGKLNFEIT